MNNADVMLEEMLANSAAPALIDPDTEPHIIVGSDRFITVPAELTKIAVQYDHKVETVTFDCPRYWDGVDMSEMRIYINYKRSDSVVGMSIPKNVTIDAVDPSIMHFDWTITRGATLAAGVLSFSVCVKKPNEAGDEDVHWNSEVNTQMKVSPGLEYEEQKNPYHTDLISDLIDRMEETELTVEKAGLYITNEQMNALLAKFDMIKYELAKRTETVTFNATIEASNWSTGEAPYTNVVSIVGVKMEDNPHAAPVYASDKTLAVLQEESWNMISDGEAMADAVIFKCFEERPVIDIPIQVECFRSWNADDYLDTNYPSADNMSF